VFPCVLLSAPFVASGAFLLGLTDVDNDSDSLKSGVEKLVRFPSEVTGVKCVT